MNLGGLSRLSNAKTRSISAENFTGEKGRAAMATEGTGASCARELGQGWKVSPSVPIQPGDTFEMAKIDGPGTIQHIWLTCHPQHWRFLVLRMYWDGEDAPSVEVPVGDFFLNGWCERSNVSSLPIQVNPAGGFNSFFEMPFRKYARITMENTGDERAILYYQITYELDDVAEDAAYLHAQWRRTNPLPYAQEYTILDGVQGRGHYVGTYLAWGVNSNNWWGEGEIKFYMDGDCQFPTICGTGTEDYFGGAWNFEQPKGQYCSFSNIFMGMRHLAPDELYHSQNRFSLYRFHIMDPIRFDSDLKVTIQALGWRSGGRYLPLRDDIASTAFWYQAEPHGAFPELPGRDEREVI